MLYFCKNIFFFTIIVALLASTIVSCERREDYSNNNNLSSEYIQFGVSDPFLKTRAKAYDPEKIVDSYVFRSEETADTLSMSSYVYDMALDNSFLTRASAVTSAPTDFTLCGYYDGELLMNQTFRAENAQGGIYSTGEYWPGASNESVHFFAYSNAPSAGFSFSSAEEGNNPTLTYEVPTDISNQKDIMMAKASAAADGSGLDSYVPLQFYHVLTAVTFELKTIPQGVIINSIVLKDIVNKGTLDFEQLLNAPELWDIDESSKVNYTFAFSNGAVPTGEGQYLMMLPQSVADKEVTIHYTKNGADATLTETLRGNWVVGKKVTYKISISSMYDLTFEVDDNEICLDAHYVRCDKMKINVGDNVPGGWYIESDADWLTIKLKSELSDLQEKGWWTEGEAGGTSEEGTGRGIIGLSLFATENIGDEDRVATLTLRAKNQENGYTPRTYTIRQLHPFWDDNDEYGSERIEEYPGKVKVQENGVTVEKDYSYSVPWGPYWRYIGPETDSPQYEVTYKIDSYNSSMFWIAVRYEWLRDELGAAIESNGLFSWRTYTFKFTENVNGVTNGTDDPGDGLENMRNGLSSETLATTSFMNELLATGRISVDETSFQTFDFSYTAFMQALKKNKVKIIPGDNSNEVDIENSEINWYLPAKLECIDVYYNNPIAHECETNLGAGNGFSNVFWTSTSETNDVAWTYQYTGDKNGKNETKGKDQLCRVRAVRKKPQN